jgi:predicted unusual protein kinase regulating ubiquinone biosynthesis (AarF/ABC1/UbiB family)
MADALVALGISRDRSDTRTDEAIAALRAHFAGVSLRAVDFRQVNLLSTWWRLSSAAGRHGARIAPELVAVALMLTTMTQTLRSLRATVDVGGAYRRARNG